MTKKTIPGFIGWLSRGILRIGSIIIGSLSLYITMVLVLGIIVSTQEAITFISENMWLLGCPVIAILFGLKTAWEIYLRD